jgi:amino acid transporter
MIGVIIIIILIGLLYVLVSLSLMWSFPSSSAICCTTVYPKVYGLSHKEIYAYNNKHSLRSNTNRYGGKTH